jgi:hypothetical protein
LNIFELYTSQCCPFSLFKASLNSWQKQLLKFSLGTIHLRLKKITSQSEAVGDDLIYLPRLEHWLYVSRGWSQHVHAGLNALLHIAPSDFSVIPIDPTVHQIIIKRHPSGVSQRFSSIHPQKISHLGSPSQILESKRGNKRHRCLEL